MIRTNKEMVNPLTIVALVLNFAKDFIRIANIAEPQA